MSAPKIPSVHLSDKWLHFVVYFFFAMLLYIARVNDTKRTVSSIPRLFFVIIIPFVVGVCIEFIQHNCIPSRHGEILDVMANTLGILVAVILAEKLKAKAIL